MNTLRVIKAPESDHYNNVMEQVKSMKRLAAEGSLLSPLKKLFGNFILENSLVHFPSERGVGKTLLGLQICLAISSKHSSYLGEEIDGHGNTLFINCELGERIMQQRLNTLFAFAPEPIEQGEYQSFVYTTRNGLDKEIEVISNLIERIKPVLVILDNFRMAFLDCDSNKNQEIAKAMNMMLTLKDKYNISIVITDHTKKNTTSLQTHSDLQSGSGVKSDLSDADFFLRKSKQAKDLRILKRSKSRNCEEQEAAKLIRLNQETLWFELVDSYVNEMEHIGGEVVESKEEKKKIAIELRKKGVTFDEIANTLKTAKTNVARWTKGID
jgi:RecA-family ATPase